MCRIPGEQQYLLWGITSWGWEPCAAANSPGAYTRVVFYVDWLNNVFSKI